MLEVSSSTFHLGHLGMMTGDIVGTNRGVSGCALNWGSLSEIAGDGMGAGRGPHKGAGWSCEG